MIKSNFRRYRHLGVPGAPTAAAATDSPDSTPSPAAAGSSQDEVPPPPPPPRNRRGNHKNRATSSASSAAAAAAANPPPTLDQVVDDTLVMTRLMAEQLRLFECTSVTESYGVRVIATATAALEHTSHQQHPQGTATSPPPPPYFFFYNIRVENRNRRSTVQLVGRHWVIQDDSGNETDSVPKGSVGVVGHEPVLRPGQAIAYMSGAKLPTPFGSMQGSFQFIKKGGEGGGVPAKFDARVAPFLLK